MGKIPLPSGEQGFRRTSPEGNFAGWADLRVPREHLCGARRCSLGTFQQSPELAGLSPEVVSWGCPGVWDREVFRWGALIPVPSSERSVQGKAGGRMFLNLKMFSQKIPFGKLQHRGW